MTLMMVLFGIPIFFIASWGFYFIKKEKYSSPINSLVTLLSLVIRCDGVISKEEKSLSLRYFNKIYEDFHLKNYIGYSNFLDFAKTRLNENLTSKSLKGYKICCLDVLRANVTYQARYDVVSILFEVAFVHEGIIYTEVQLLRNIAHFLLIKKDDLFALEEKYGVTKKEEKKNSQTDYLHNLYIHTLSQSYRTLELEPSVKKEEIKRAYRRLAMKYHPDRLPLDATEEARAQAASQFRLVNEAFNYLCKERKLK